MRQTFLVLVLVLVAWADSASAQQVAVGGWIASRDGSDSSVGGGVSAGAGGQRAALTAEASVTRRDGHNDWRALGGVRLWLTEPATINAYVHGLAGALFRNSESGLALVGGGGIEIRGRGRLALRLQADVTRDRAAGHSATGARGSVWLVIR